MDDEETGIIRAVILCPGPSLGELETVPAHNISIAVNRAALRFPCQWWAALDFPMIRDNRDKVLGNPALLTHTTTWNDIHAKVAPFPRFQPLEAIEEWCWVKFERRTTPAALLLAGYLGATEIDLYGDDRTQEPDYDGHENEETMLHRNPERWEKEARDCDAITSWLAERGVKVTRHESGVSRTGGRGHGVRTRRRG